MQLGDQRRLLQHDLRDERSRLEVSPTLELEEVALGADHVAGAEPMRSRPIIGS